MTRRIGRTLAILVACALPSGCGEAARRLGGGEHAATDADQLLGALAARFGPLRPDDSFVSRRARLASAALVPSRAFADQSLWTGVDDGWRRLDLAGRPREDGYRLSVRPGVAAPSTPGEYRAVIALRELARGEYEWRGSDELAVGPVTGADFDRALTALLLSCERGGSGDARALVRADLPRAAAAWGRLFAMESLTITAAGAGADVTVAVIVDPRGIDGDFPRYAAYLRKYLAPVRLNAIAFDGDGRRWWEADLRDMRFTLRLRVQGGNLAPLGGGVPRIPATLSVRGDVSTRMGIFRLGMRALEADVELVRAPQEKAFAARFRREPDWQLPFLLEPFLRASLRRPFAGEGALLGLAVRNHQGQTTLERDYDVAVRESWIVRWLGGQAQTAMDEFRRGAEEEADRFSGEALEALRQDVRALLSLRRPGSSNGNPIERHTSHLKNWKPSTRRSLLRMVSSHSFPLRVSPPANR